MYKFALSPCVTNEIIKEKYDERLKDSDSNQGVNGQTYFPPYGEYG